MALALFLAFAVSPRTLRADDERLRPEQTLSLFGMSGQGFHQEGQGFAEFGSPALQGGRFLSRRLELLLELHPVLLVRQPKTPPYGERETVEAFALDLGLRWFWAPASWKARPYLEVLDGPFYALRRIPARGSAFNFLTQLGAGVLLPLGDGWHPFAGYRWVHISNAGLGEHNPDWDFHALLLGAVRRFN